jgi:hypothetical protein
LCKIHSFIIPTFHALISCIENTFDTWIYRKMQNSCDIHLFIGSYFIRQYIYPCVKCVFNAWYFCLNCMNLWMNKLHMIFIINSSHAKFMTNIVCIQYFKYQNISNIFFEWHTWMFMFNTLKLHNLMWNYIMIIAQFYLKCKLYIVHIETS